MAGSCNYLETFTDKPRNDDSRSGLSWVWGLEHPHLAWASHLWHLSVRGSILRKKWPFQKVQVEPAKGFLI